jgi:hypothetical protein
VDARVLGEESAIRRAWAVIRRGVAVKGADDVRERRIKVYRRAPRRVLKRLEDEFLDDECEAFTATTQKCYHLLRVRLTSERTHGPQNARKNAVARNTRKETTEEVKEVHGKGCTVFDTLSSTRYL